MTKGVLLQCPLALVDFQHKPPLLPEQRLGVGKRVRIQDPDVDPVGRA